jgi:hypothetical protein
MRIAIGLLSDHEAASIAHVRSEVDAGLLRIVAPADCIIINADGESPDTTARIFLETPTRCRQQSLITTPHRGKGSNVPTILDIAVNMRSRRSPLLAGIVPSPVKSGNSGLRPVTCAPFFDF